MHARLTSNKLLGSNIGVASTLVVVGRDGHVLQGEVDCWLIATADELTHADAVCTTAFNAALHRDGSAHCETGRCPCSSCC
jgi:hypothetical protein